MCCIPGRSKYSATPDSKTSFLCQKLLMRVGHIRKFRLMVMYGVLGNRTTQGVTNEILEAGLTPILKVSDVLKIIQYMLHAF